MSNQIQWFNRFSIIGGNVKGNKIIQKNIYSFMQVFFAQHHFSTISHFSTVVYLSTGFTFTTHYLSLMYHLAWWVFCVWRLILASSLLYFFSCILRINMSITQYLYYLRIFSSKISVVIIILQHLIKYLMFVFDFLFLNNIFNLSFIFCAKFSS